MEEKQTEHLTEETQADASQLNAAAGDEAESVAPDSSATDSLTLEELNEITGKNYKDKDSALKSIKDMNSQAGKAANLEGQIKAAKQDPEVSSDELATLREELNQTKLEVFYSQNPDANRELLETIAKANGLSPQEAMNTDLYKNTVAKEPEKRTVAASNNRVASGEKPFNPADYPGDKDALAKYVTENYLMKK